MKRLFKSAHPMENGGRVTTEGETKAGFAKLFIA
jgi:hypothetical protein